MQYKNILVAGSVAFDYLFRYEGELKEHFEGHDLSNLSTCFFSPNREKFYGGTGGNIAYGLSLFGEKSHLIGTVGDDFEGDYKDWLTGRGASLDFVRTVEGGDTACAYIISDDKENQVAIFYPGASLRDYDFGLDLKKHKDSLLIISPMNLESMVRLAREAREAGVDYIFDPGQQITLFDPEFMKEIVEGAFATILNDYELKLLSNVLDPKRLRRVIVTLGGEGSEIIDEANVIEVGAVKPDRIADPTGCGDAYRAGLIHGLKAGFDLKKSCQIGALNATYKIETEGTQNYGFSIEEFKARYKDSFKEEL
ncbi:MAG: carbohydrate kinase family protein [Patescibacteria group bacterium]|nr:carbohydrate kinase family protein [Patescibacteria group bacterium]